MTNEEMSKLIECAIQVLEAEWQADIKDPLKANIERAVRGEMMPETNRWAERIERYIRAAGKVWARILDRRPGPPHYRTVDAWCGFFVNYGFVMAHTMPDAPQFKLNPRISEIVMPSTYRISSRAKWLQAGFLRVMDGTAIKPQDIRRGDVVTITTSRTDPKDYGDHYILATSSVDANGNFTSIEGNAEGKKPTGPDNRQGVVKCVRPISRVKRVYRFEPRHFVEVK